jgi:hypothetical protein
MLSSFEVKCGTRAAGRKPVRGVVFIATTAEALAAGGGVATATAEWDDMDEDRWEEHLDGLKRGTFGGWECDMCMGFNCPDLDVCALCCR